MSNIVKIHNEGLKIKDFNKFNFLELEAKLTTICILIGISKLEQKMLEPIISFLKQGYKDFSIKEIEMAFQLLGEGKLERVKEHFNSFDIIYLGSVLNAYRLFRSKEMLRVENERKNKELLAPLKKTIGNEILHKFNYEYVIDEIKKTGKIPLGAAWADVYLHLEKIGEIKMSLEEKNKFAENVKNELIEEQKDAFFKKDRWLIDFIKRILERKDDLAFECRKRVVIRYFKEKYKLN